MANQQLVDYIRSQLAVGVTKEDLRKAITDAGWAAADSQAAFDVIEEKALPRPAMPAPAQSSIPAIERMPARPARRPRSRAWIWVLIVVIILIVIAGAFYFVPSLRATAGLGGTATSTATLIAVQEPVVTATSTTATSTTPLATSTSTTTP